MSRIFYAAGIFIFGLILITGLTESLLYLQVGDSIHFQDSSLSWFLFVQTLAFLGMLILLKYYHLKKFNLAFLAGIIYTLFVLWQVYHVYNLLLSGQQNDYLILSIKSMLAAGFIYGLVIAFSDAGKRLWLKMAGIVGAFLNLFLLSLFLWRLDFSDGAYLVLMENLHKWAVLAVNIIPVCYLLNFWNEYKKSGTEKEQTKKEKSLQEFLVLAGSVTFIFTIVMLQTITQESKWHREWLNSLPEREQKLKQQFDERTYFSNEKDTLQYLLLKPLDYDPQKEYPLVLILPAGGYESDAAHLLSKEIYRKQYPAFLMVPYCPPGEGWGGIPGYPTIDTLVFDAVTALDPEFAIDRERRYITGVSRGAYGSWHFISTRPDLFAAAIPISGAGNSKFAQEIKDVSVWAFHGSNDRNVPVSGSREIIAAIRQAGGNPRYTEYADEAHNVSGKALETPGLWEWLFEQEKE